MSGQALPVCKPQEVIKALERDGWRISRQKGSHAILAKVGARSPVVVPCHDKDVPTGTLRNILRMSGLSIERFSEILR